MKYPHSILEEIKARLPASSIVGQSVRLKKAGKEWKGLSPFTAEKTPSFTVNDHKQFYHCFSTGKHGDIFRFLMETEGISFSEAVERLAQEAGVILPTYSKYQEEKEAETKSLFDVMELATQFFSKKLMEIQGSDVQHYLEGRLITPQLQERFRLGLAPKNRYALRDFLAEKGVSSEQMIQAGLLISGEDISVPFDRFRDRLMIPIIDTKGRIIAFGGRALQAEAQPKYLNSPATPLFNKGATLYNLNHARKAAFDSGSLIVVEGYMDVIALDRIGIHHGVAPLGTALTEEQLNLIWRLVDVPIMCFDGDRAGKAAAFRALDLALPHLKAGKSLKFVFLPDGQDPDDISKTGGKTMMNNLLQQAQPLIECLWRREIETENDTPEQRAAIEKRLKDAIQTIRDEVVRKYYGDDIIQRLEGIRPHRAYSKQKKPQREEIFRNQGSSLKKIVQYQKNISSNQLMNKVSEPPREAFIVAASLHHPSFILEHAEELARLEFKAHSCHALLARIMEYCAAREDTDTEELENYLKNEKLWDQIEHILSRVRPGDHKILEETIISERVREEFRQALKFQLQAFALQRELKEAETALANDLTEENLQRLQDVKAQLASINEISAE